MKVRLSRRLLLKGAGGVAVGLPALECMLDFHGKVQAQAGGVPRRYALLSAGQAIGGDQWERDQQQVDGRRFQEAGHFIVPPETGTGYTVTTPLQPLRDLKADFTLVSDLRIPFNAASTDSNSVPAAGAYRDFHGGGASPLLCGTRSLGASFRCRSVTSDQVIANLYAGQTTFDSLVLRAQPSWYLSGSSYSGRQYISYRGDGDPIEAQTSPQVAFRSLFGNFRPDDADAQAQHDSQQRSRRSVLDVITAKRARILSRVGNADRLRLERHFDEIRDLENRITAVPSGTGAGCQVPPDPGADPAIGANNGGSRASDIGSNTGYSQETERARLMADLIHMAFVCDLTRVATLQLTVFQSHMNVLPISTALGTPIRADLHEVGHNGDDNNRGQLPVSLMLQWHLSHYAYLLDKLKSTPEGSGTLLDHCAVVFLPEAGHGRQLNDGSTPNQTHSVEDMVALVAGRAGGLKPGGHVRANGAHPVQVLITAMQAAGYADDRLGEVRGNLPTLIG